MTRLNLSETPWREDWKSFLSTDDKKRHWINQRILEDENTHLQETPQPPIPRFVPEKKIKVNPLKVIYMFLP